MTPDDRGHVGRFAPSPTGPLHAGSLASALASYLDARAHDGRWLLRIEDLDPPREVPGAASAIIDVLGRLGFAHDGDIEFQSRRSAHYERAFDALHASGRIYACSCSRREIIQALSLAGRPHRTDEDPVYPGTCRADHAAGRVARAWRVRVDDACIDWQDRNGTVHCEHLATEAGDFVLRRADGLWAYQLAVVVDDADQGVTHVVRGADLLRSTSRQIFLQRALGLPTPRYLHVPVVTDPQGRKLSKQTGATALDLSDPLAELNRALVHLGLSPVAAPTLSRFWPQAIERWSRSAWMRSDLPGAAQQRSQGAGGATGP